MLVEKQFIFGDSRINYDEGPDSGPPLLLLHGNSWRWQSFLPIIPVLSLRWKIFAPDFRGHGNSKHIPHSYSIDNYLVDTLAFIDNVIKKPVCIFGHSMGGAISFLIAAQKPEMVKGLIIGDMSLQKSDMEKKIGESQDLIRQWMEWAGLEISNMELLKKIMNFPMKLLEKFQLGGYNLPDQEEPIPWKKLPNVIPWLLFLSQNLSKLDPTTQEGGLSLDKLRETWKLYDYNIFLPKIACPVLLLQASEELGGVMTDSDVELAEEYIEYLVHMKFEDIDHGLFASKTEPILKVVMDFLELLRD